jgi:serine protease Do
MSDMIVKLNEELADVVEQAKRSLVHVSNGRESHGAGVIVSSDGLILTNAHVVRRDSVEVTLPDQSRLRARVLAHDRERDLALLKVDTMGLPALEVSNTSDMEPGQWVIAIGHPWGIMGAVTSGVLIDNGQRVSEQEGGRQEWLAASLHLRPGNSGGPLIDVNGRLLGINTVMAGLDVGLAIPADSIRRFLKEASQARIPDDRPHNATPNQNTPTII